MTESQILWEALKEQHSWRLEADGCDGDEVSESWDMLESEIQKKIDQSNTSPVTHENIMNLIWEHNGKWIKIRECIDGVYFSDDISGALSKLWFEGRQCGWPIEIENVKVKCVIGGENIPITPTDKIDIKVKSEDELYCIDCHMFEKTGDQIPHGGHGICTKLKKDGKDEYEYDITYPLATYCKTIRPNEYRGHCSQCIYYDKENKKCPKNNWDIIYPDGQSCAGGISE